MPKPRPNSKHALTKRDQTTSIARPLSDPMANLGPHADQVPIKFPVIKIEYLAIPETKQLHPDWQPGKFSISIGEQLDHLELALLAIRYGRMKWPPNFDPKNPDVDPECKSDNGLVPSGGSLFPLSDIRGTFNGEKSPLCVYIDEENTPTRDQIGRYIPACKFAQWGPKNEPPQCKEFFGLFVWEHQLNIPALFTIKSTGIKHLSDLRTQFASYQQTIKFIPKHPITAYAKIKVDILNKGRWYEPYFKIVDTFSDPDVLVNVAAIAQYRLPIDNLHAQDFSDFNSEPTI